MCALYVDVFKQCAFKRRLFVFFLALFIVYLVLGLELLIYLVFQINR